METAKQRVNRYSANLCGTSLTHKLICKYFLFRKLFFILTLNKILFLAVEAFQVK